MARPDRPLTHLLVTGTERLSPGMIRVRLVAEDPAAFAERFADSVLTDRYVKLALTGPDGEQVVRTYTALEPDLEQGTLAIDFVVHGTDGVAGPWAASARVGDRLSLRGPGGGYAPDPTADWHLVAGDQSALPAIRAALAALPGDAVGFAVLQVPDADHEQPLAAPSGVEVSWVHGADSGALVDAVRALSWRTGRVHAFVHGEAESVMHGIRPYLLKERAVPRTDASISGYWREGRTEDTFRRWKAELAVAESA
ncbi:NADPH-dependent ferric siderophore reductase, contains FAD-binding and SIP domains [Nocardioides terrae]|uniref:NADPH-dependent ferric siderophore reductase, contains FAD-binding and SIP domains n=1 Tax=Nocardioides terrae TaxID=574651 RepID=A0A1I1I3N4_9ACTN|nr:siderophore-interacting protein [Nocardioides terrae]SFC27830.1 NADPH-dependent ferric siderophore reductase, contains FAD-binding and SIP domains [Nocardioides terrae]